MIAVCLGEAQLSQLKNRFVNGVINVIVAQNALSRSALTVAVIAVDKYGVEGLRESVKSLSGFNVAAEFPGYGGAGGVDVIEGLRQRGYDICVIDFDQDRQQAIALAEQIRNAATGAAVFALSGNSDPELIIQAMHAGCSEYLVKPLAKERVVQALIRMQNSRRMATPSKRGRIYTVIGAKGGTGVTTLATHVAAYVAKSGAKTLLIDQHPDLGDASVYLSLGEHRYHYYELANNIHRLDAQLVEGFLLHHRSGLDVLPSPESFGAMVQASPTAMNHTLAFLKDIYDVIVIDCAPGLNGANVIAIEQADAIFLVATPELAAIRNLARYLDHLRHHDCPDDKVQVVINRYSKKAAITQEKIEKAIQRPVSLLIPNSYQDAIAALHAGQPMSYESKSELAVALRGWASSLSEQPETLKLEPPKRRFGILGL